MKKKIIVHHPKTEGEFKKLNRELNRRGFVAIDVLKPGPVRDITIGAPDPANSGAQDLAQSLGSGAWSNGPLSKVAWSFNDRSQNKPTPITGKDGKPLGNGYIPWGPGDNTPSVIPVLAKALPYTAAPLRYIADLTAGLGPKLMYRFPDGTLCEFKDASYFLRLQIQKARKQEEPDLARISEETEYENGYIAPYAQDADGNLLPVGEIAPENRPSQLSTEGLGVDYWKELYDDWWLTWFGNEVTDENGYATHIPGAKEFLEDNNLNFHLTQCMQDDVMLDIYFPTVGFQRGRRGKWDPKIVRVGYLPPHVRFEVMNEYRHINHLYFSDRWRTKGIGDVAVPGSDEIGTVMYPTAMPEHTLSDLRYIVESNQRTRIKERPTWVVCPTYYPSGGPYYPQPAWWSVFTSKAFDFSSTILYDKAKARENKTSWGKIIYISIDYLDMVFSDKGYQGNPDKKQQFIEELDKNMEDFLQQRDNNGKMMRQFMFTTPDGKEHHNVEIVDVAETTKDSVTAGKEELELSTSPIFLALQVDPRLVGVPMVAASNGGTALREMHLLKQQQLNVKQRLYLQFLNTVCRFNGWSDRAEFVITQQTLTTLDNSKTGTVDTIAGEKS